MNRLPRKFEIHRHRNQVGAHDAVVGREIFGPVCRQDGDTFATREASARQRARHAIGHGIEPGIVEFARCLFAAEIDDRDLVQIAVTADEVAEIAESRHAKRILMSWTAR